MTALPVLEVLPDLLRALDAGSNAVLVAPPGAGKTTAVAPALLNQPWCAGQILLLSPRRLAARAAAERMAEQVGEPVGRTIGYATRMDAKVSAATHILVLTEGIFRSRIQSDPELAGISAVLFDEVHERSLDSDFGLALALDAQAGLRPDLRVVAMSATLDGARFAALMDAPVIESAGRAHPLELRHIGRCPDARIEEEMAAAIRRALVEASGDVLAFLPGVAEIDRTAERLADVSATVHRLHGGLDPADQRAAISRGMGRKIILATSIAETSLTIDGVRIVVDSGLARRARYDRQAGITRLVTERASQAAVTQRAGRAARQGPGVAYRLWEDAATTGLLPYDPPEILEADLSPLLLDCALWGVTEPATLRWLDPPPVAAVTEARNRLRALAAIDAGGAITDHGRAMARLPLPPRLAHMLIAGQAIGLAHVAADCAALLSERGLGGNETDLEQRLGRWRNDRSPRAESARAMVRRWTKLLPPAPSLPDPGRPVALAIALAFPDRVAKRRDSSGEHWLSVGGRGFRLDPTHPLAKADWLAVADVQGAASGARILAAAAIDFADIESLFAGRIVSSTSVTFDPRSGGVLVEVGRRLGAITLSRGPDAKADPAAIVLALLDGVRQHGLDKLPWGEATLRLLDRAIWAGLMGLSETALVDALDEWLPPLLGGKRRLSDIESGALHQAMLTRLGWDGQRMIDRLAPAHFTSPAGTTHAIDYSAEAGPTVEVRVQALFGLAQHPSVGVDHIPLVLSLTSPAGRPIQTTRDLPGFWAGSWREVAKDMRGRYPRHNWPDDPTAAVASLKTKKALAKKS
jgi:ATP-dependent helicase HrpB